MVDGGVMSQTSQLILSKSLVFFTGFFILVSRTMVVQLPVKENVVGSNPT